MRSRVTEGAGHLRRGGFLAGPEQTLEMVVRSREISVNQKDREGSPGVLSSH